MAGEKERVEGYLGTIDRLEPEIYPIDLCAAQASMAISLKRIADALEGKPRTHLVWAEETIRENASQPNAHLAIHENDLDVLTDQLLIAVTNLRNRTGLRIAHHPLPDPKARAAVVLAAFLGQPEPVVVLPRSPSAVRDDAP